MTGRRGAVVALSLGMSEVAGSSPSLTTRIDRRMISLCTEEKSTGDGAAILALKPVSRVN